MIFFHACEMVAEGGQMDRPLEILFSAGKGVDGQVDYRSMIFFLAGKVVAVDGRVPIRLQLGPMAYHRVQKGWGLGLVNSNGEEW